MKKKLIAVFSSFAMLASVAVGMVQTAYASASMTLVYDAENSTDTVKVVKAYYDDIDLYGGSGTVVVSAPGATVAGATAFTSYAKAVWDLNPDTNIYTLTYSEDDALETADQLFATFTITVPEGTGEFTVSVENGIYNNYDLDDVVVPTASVTIPGASTPDPEPVVSAVETTLVQAAYQGEANDGSVADIYKATITANDFAVTGASVTVNGETKEIEVPVIASGTADFAIVIGYAGGASLGYEPEVTLN